MKKALFYIYSLSLTLIFGGFLGCAGPKAVQGTYKVTGSTGAVANIVYAASGLGGNSQAVSQTLPWQVQFNGYESEGNYQGTYVFLSAVNDAPATSSSSITITILEDNSLFQQPDYVTGGSNPITEFGYF
jgi:hypothetical protein